MSGGSVTSVTSVATRGKATRWLNAECSTTASANPGAKATASERPRCSSIVRPIIAKTAVVAPCMIAVPSPRTTQMPTPAFGDQVLIVEVFDDREARSRGEAQDRGVDQEADAMGANEHHDDQRFRELLNHRRDVARVRLAVERRHAQEPGVDAVADRRRNHAAPDDRDHEPERNELVAVEVEQRREKAQHGREPDQQVEGDLADYRSLRSVARRRTAVPSAMAIARRRVLRSFGSLMPT